MKKSMNVIMIVSLFMLSVAPALAATDNGTNISTGFTRDSGGGASPIVKAKWEMDNTRGDDGRYLGTDALPDLGAQFMPSGQFDVDKTITVCAIVTDPDGVADINSVYADVFYPENVWLGPNHEANRQGCGQLMNELSLGKLTKADGIELVCNRLKNSNNNLPTWNAGYDYAEVCNLDGELWKETAYVYCGEKTLSYEDPAGMYKTLVLAQDKAGMDGTLTNQFEYLALTAFETDFSSVSYGNVKLNTHKIVNGDLTWGEATKPSVRNVGTTRLSMNVWQNDMGLGQTDGKWNVRYDGRVGSDAAFVEYDPEVTTKYAEPMNLSELDEMDFSILVYKFPPTHTSMAYTGNMVLSATAEEHLCCDALQN